MPGRASRLGRVRVRGPAADDGGRVELLQGGTGGFGRGTSRLLDRVDPAARVHDQADRREQGHHHHGDEQGDRARILRYSPAFVRLRDSVRALVVDPYDAILLVRFFWEGLGMTDGFWATPGGGIEPGETRLEAIQRELREETGLIVDHLGPEVWTKTTIFPMAPWDGQVDHIHLYRTGRFDPTPELSRDQLEAENLREIRWWSPEELSGPGVIFAPRSLPRLMSRLRTDGLPTAPIEIDGF